MASQRDALSRGFSRWACALLTKRARRHTLLNEGSLRLSVAESSVRHLQHQLDAGRSFR